MMNYISLEADQVSYRSNELAGVGGRNGCTVLLEILGRRVSALTVLEIFNGYHKRKNPGAKFNNQLLPICFSSLGL